MSHFAHNLLLGCVFIIFKIAGPAGAAAEGRGQYRQQHHYYRRRGPAAVGDDEDGGESADGSSYGGNTAGESEDCGIVGTRRL